MSNNVNAVLASKPAQVIFEERRTIKLQELYGAHATNSVHQDKAALVDSTNIENNAESSISKPQPVPPNKKRTISKPKTRSRKKNQSVTSQACHSIKSGSHNTLDLASPGSIPKRFKGEIQKISKKLGSTLALTANAQERQLLIRFSNAKSLEDIDSLVKSIPLVPQTGSFTFLSIALTKLIALW
ncbi:hypothetical protein MBANPS3_004222 [Mucor bainieri]